MFIEAKDDGGGGDNWSRKSCIAPVKSSLPRNQHQTYYRPDALPVAQPTASEHWTEVHHRLLMINVEPTDLSQIYTSQPFTVVQEQPWFSVKALDLNLGLGCTDAHVSRRWRREEYPAAQLLREREKSHFARPPSFHNEGLYNTERVCRL